MDALAQATGTTPPAQLAALREAPVLHDDVVDIAGMGAFVEQAVAKL